MLTSRRPMASYTGFPDISLWINLLYRFFTAIYHIWLKDGICIDFITRPYSRTGAYVHLWRRAFGVGRASAMELNTFFIEAPQPRSFCLMSFGRDTVYKDCPSNQINAGVALFNYIFWVTKHILSKEKLQANPQPSALWTTSDSVIYKPGNMLQTIRL